MCDAETLCESDDVALGVHDPLGVPEIDREIDCVCVCDTDGLLVAEPVSDAVPEIEGESDGDAVGVAVRVGACDAVGVSDMLRVGDALGVVDSLLVAVVELD